jgi:hypothetical protein
MEVRCLSSHWHMGLLPMTDGLFVEIVNTFTACEPT